MTALGALEMLRPATVAEAVEALGGGAETALLAGGTDLVPNLRRGIGDKQRLVDLSGVTRLSSLLIDERGASIGAGVTLARLADDPRIAACFAAIAEAAEAVAAPAHRSAATIGGNLCLDTRCVYYNQGESWRRANGYCLKYRGEVCHVAPTGKRCHAAYSGDLAPALIALDARAVVVGPAGRRKVAVAALFRDDGRDHLALAPGELISRFDVPALEPNAATGYEKGRLRGAIDFPLAGVGGMLAIEAGKIRELRLAVTGTNPRPFLVEGLIGLVGLPLDESVLEKIEKAIQKQATPKRTTVAAAHYRRHLAGALARKLLLRLAGARPTTT